MVFLSVSSKAAESSPGGDFLVMGNVQAGGMKGSERTPSIPGGRRGPVTPSFLPSLRFCL